MPRYRPIIKHSAAHVHWIADFIRRERVRKKLSQLTLSIDADVSPGTLGHYEGGHTTLASLFQLEKILATLGYELHIRKKGQGDDKATY